MPLACSLRAGSWYAVRIREMLINRRRFLTTLAAGAAAFGRAPAIARQRRPTLPYGVASGDVTRDRAIIWSRCDRAARMLVEWDTTESFRDAQRVISAAVARPETGLTSRVDLGNLPIGQTIFYRVRFEDLKDSRSVSEPVTGSFRTPPVRPGDVTLAWSADTVGQGWGINRDWGGLKMFDTIRRAQPDVFVHCGDTIYADGPLVPEMKLPDGTIWKNIVTPAKSKVAETLDEFRGNYLYNLQDEHVRNFNASVSQIALWDDHEVKNNWYPGMSLAADQRYSLVTDSAVLIRNARQAFIEHMPMRIASARPSIYRSFSRGPLLDVFALDLRSYRGPNSANRQPAAGPDTQLAGPAQIEWLKRALLGSRAVWKIIASDLPIGLLVRDGPSAFEAIANGEGPPLGRELEIADLLRFIARERITNVVWITADVHYTAAHHYDPARARFKEFAPFWEFVSGPMHADTGPRSVLDDTFGPEVRFASAAPDGTYVGPSAGLQFFGFITIRGASRVMTVHLRNLNGDTIYSVDLEPAA